MSDLRERVLDEAANHYYDGSPKRANTPLTDALVALCTSAMNSASCGCSFSRCTCGFQEAERRVRELMGVKCR